MIEENRPARTLSFNSRSKRSEVYFYRPMILRKNDNGLPSETRKTNCLTFGGGEGSVEAIWKVRRGQFSVRKK